MDEESDDSYSGDSSEESDDAYNDNEVLYVYLNKWSKIINKYRIKSHRN